MSKNKLVKRLLAFCICPAMLVSSLAFDTILDFTPKDIANARIAGEPRSDGHSTTEFIQSSSYYSYVSAYKKYGAWAYNPSNNEYRTSMRLSQAQGVETSSPLNTEQKVQISSASGVSFSSEFTVQRTDTIVVPPYKSARSTFTPYMQVVAGQLVTTTHIDGMTNVSRQNVTIYIPVSDGFGLAQGTHSYEIA